MKRLLATLAIPALGLGLLASPALTETADAAAKPYHILNASASNGPVNIYGYLGCDPNGPIHILYSGQDADSTGWDSFRVYGRNFNVLVYDGSTGNLLADREYSSGTCVKAYKTNDYRVQVY